MQMFWILLILLLHYFNIISIRSTIVYDTQGCWTEPWFYSHKAIDVSLEFPDLQYLYKFYNDSNAVSICLQYYTFAQIT